MSRPHVIILGAGYAGRSAIGRLARTSIDLTVVDASPVFVERVRLHLTAAGAPPPVHALRPWVEGLGHRFVQGRAVGLEDRTLVLEDGSRLDFDQCIVALGSVAARVPGTAHGVATLSEARRTAERVARLSAGSEVVVVGAGATGIETVCAGAEAHPGLRWHLVDSGRLAERYSADVAAMLSARLAELGVALTESCPVSRMAPDSWTHEGATEAVGAVIFCGGFAASPALSALSLAAPGEQAPVASTLLARERVWVAGDAARVAGQPWVRMSCAAAMPMGCHAADNVSAVLADRAPRPLSLGFMGMTLATGANDCILQRTDAADRPTRGHQGRWVAAVKGLLFRYTVVMPKLEATTGLRLNRWPAAPRPQLLEATL